MKGIARHTIVMFLLFFCIVPLRAQKLYTLPKSSVPLMLTWGLPDIDHENINYECAKKFGFRYYRIGACLLPEEWRKAANKHNERTEQRIAKKFGKDWRQLLQKECTRLYANKKIVDSLLMWDAVGYGRVMDSLPKDFSLIIISANK